MFQFSFLWTVRVKPCSICLGYIVKETKSFGHPQLPLPSVWPPLAVFPGFMSLCVLLTAVLFQERRYMPSAYSMSVSVRGRFCFSWDHKLWFDEMVYLCKGNLDMEGGSFSPPETALLGVENSGQETQDAWVPSLGGEDLLEKEMATHSRILPGKSHGQKSLACCSLCGHRKWDMTEHAGSPSPCTYASPLPWNTDGPAPF